MFLVFFAVFFGILYFVIGDLYCTPYLNKTYFSKIWSEEEPPPVKRETLERMKELFADSDVPEETVLRMAAKEENLHEQEILNLFNAVSARELARIFRARNNTLRFMALLSVLCKVNKNGMRGPRG